MSLLTIIYDYQCDGAYQTMTEKEESTVLFTN